MADGKVVIEILGDSSKFASEVSKLTDTTSKAISSLGSGFSKAGTVLTAAVTAPLAIAGVKAAQWASQTAANAEQVDIAFNTMLGPERAKKMIADLVEFAKTTPFEMAGLNKATQQMLAYGFAANDIIPMLTDVGNATAALGAGQQGIDAITRALGQMHGKGTAASQEMMQLTEVGIPAWDYLAKALHTDVAGAMEMVTKKAVSADVAIAAIRAGMQGDFGGLMIKQSRTLTGVLSNLSDAATATIMKMYQTDGYKKMTDALSKLADPIQKLIESLMPLFERGMEALAAMATNAANAISQMSASDIQTIAKSIGMLAGTGPALLVIGKSMETAGKMLGAFSKASGTVANGLSVIKGMVPGTLSTVAGLSTGFKSFFGVIAATVQDKLETAILYAWEFRDSLLKAFSSSIASKLGGVGNAIAGVFGPALTGLGPKLLGAVQPAMGMVANLAAGFGSATVVLGVLSIAAAVAGTAFVAMGGDITQAAANIASNIVGIADTIPGLASQISSVLPQVASGLASAGPTLAHAFEVLFGQMGAAWQQIAPGLLEAVGAAAGAICDILVASAPSLMAGAMQAFTFILQALTEVAGQLTEAAPQILQGLVDGFVVNAPALFEAAQGLFMGLVDGVVTIIPALAAALPQIIDVFITGLPGFVGTLLQAAVDLFVAIVNAIPVILPGLIGNVGNLIGTVVSNLPTFIGMLLGAAVTLFTAIVTAVPQIIGSLLGAVGNLLNQAKNAITSFDLGSAGRAFIQGFVNGVTGLASWVVDQVCGVFNGVVGAVKALLGIHSPSRVMAGLGSYTVDGFVVGIAGGKRDVYKAAQDLAEAAQSGVDGYALNVPINKQMDMTASLVANGIYADTNQAIADLSAQMDVMTKRIEDAYGKPVRVDVNNREFGRMVREVSA
ncbi:MAG: tape measure protein [Lancefieldella parvula]|uniref:Tape measure protein n=1 Tax=Lancefieldella parvula TaxID=1382 RepID=A0A9E7D3R9_9ACTN|nr:MAG: tape measure protein [Lancefieldella parvula]